MKLDAANGLAYTLYYIGKLFRQISFGLHCSLATTAGCDNGLTVIGVGAIAGGEHPLHARAWRVALGLDIAHAVHVELATEDVGIGLVANGKEEAIDRQVVFLLVGLALLQTR